MTEINNSTAGVVGDHTHVEGGIHIHGQPTRPPRQLPRRPDHFTGRGQEVEDLISALRPGRMS